MYQTCWPLGECNVCLLFSCASQGAVAIARETGARCRPMPSGVPWLCLGETPQCHGASAHPTFTGAAKTANAWVSDSCAKSACAPPVIHGVSSRVYVFASAPFCPQPFLKERSSTLQALGAGIGVVGRVGCCTLIKRTGELPGNAATALGETWWHLTWPMTPTGWQTG